jgi:hypothetical protein
MRRVDTALVLNAMIQRGHGFHKAANPSKPRLTSNSRPRSRQFVEEMLLKTAENVYGEGTAGNTGARCRPIS